MIVSIIQLCDLCRYAQLSPIYAIFIVSLTILVEIRKLGFLVAAEYIEKWRYIINKKVNNTNMDRMYIMTFFMFLILTNK